MRERPDTVLPNAPSRQPPSLLYFVWGEKAERFTQALAAGEAGGAFIFQGRMVDAPVLREARRIVELARFY